MVSLKDIAAACGVSASTVSKALNDLDDISEKRKAMIRQKANEMGYLPNMAARALKTKMTHNIGVLFIDDYHSGPPTFLLIKVISYPRFSTSVFKLSKTGAKYGCVRPL